MNGKQRVLAAINGDYKDRPALSLTLSLYGARLIKCPLTEYYCDPDKYVEGQQKSVDIIAPDLVYSPFALPLYGKAFGSEIKIYQNQAPNLAKPVIKKIEDIKKLDFKMAIESAEINYFVESIKGLHRALGNETFIGAIALGPVDLPIMLMGIGDWLDLVISHPDEAASLIEKTSDFFLELSELFFDAGASAIVLPSCFVNPSIVTKEIAIDLLAKSEKAFANAKGPLVLHSAGAKLLPFLNIFQELKNVAAFVISSDDDIQNARHYLPDGHVIIGNLEGPDLNRMEPNEIAGETEKICNTCDADPHFIFGTSGADIPYDTPLENILIIKETLEMSR